MKTASDIVALATLLVAGTAFGADNAVLDALGSLLRDVRALHPRQGASLSCPEHLDRLRGVRKAEVLVVLKSPDFEEMAGEISQWSYFLTAPTPTAAEKDHVVVTSGGGFPVVTFAFGKADLVERATCVYAR